MSVTETGPVLDIDVSNLTGPYESVGLGIDANLGQLYNSTAATGDHTTLATAYSTGYTSIGGVQNVVRRVRGFRMPPRVKSEFYYLFRVPSGSLGGALTNGLNFEVIIAMDPNVNDADLSGTKAYFDIVASPINAAQGAISSKTPDDSVFGTTTCVALQTAALPTVVGQLFLVVLPLVNASLNTPAVGEWFLVRLRRLGDHQNDTNTGFLDLVAISAYAY